MKGLSCMQLELGSLSEQGPFCDWKLESYKGYRGSVFWLDLGRVARYYTMRTTFGATVMFE